MSTIDEVRAVRHPGGSVRRDLADERRAPASVRAAQLLSVLLALPMTIGSFMFAVITPDHHYAAWVTWLFSPIAFAIGLGLLVTAPVLARHGSKGRDRALRLLLAAQIFSVVKLTVFGEVESVPFLVLASVAFGLLCTRSARYPRHPKV